MCCSVEQVRTGVRVCFQIAIENKIHLKILKNPLTFYKKIV